MHLMDVRAKSRPILYHLKTLFRLPLRNRQQSLQSALSDEYHSINKVNGLISTYWTLAPQSLLFIPVRSIIAWDRSKSGFIRKKWSTHSNCSTTDIGENRHSRLSLTLQHGSAYEYLQNWHIASRTIPFADIPLRFQHLECTGLLRLYQCLISVRISRYSVHVYNPFCVSEPRSRPQYMGITIKKKRYPTKIQVCCL